MNTTPRSTAPTVRPPSPEGVRGPRIGIVSPCGWGNLGDAAIVHAVMHAIRGRWPGAEIFALTLNPGDTFARHGIRATRLTTFSRPSYTVEGTEEAVGLRSSLRAGAREWSAHKRDAEQLAGCSLLIVAGGGQLDDYWGGAWGHPYALWKWTRLAKHHGVPVAIVGAGFGTARNALSRYFLRHALKRASTRSIRDEGSLQLTHDLGAWAPLKLCPDLAFGLPTRPRAERGSAAPIRIGVSPMAFGDPRVWPEQDAAAYRSYLERLADTVRQCVRAGYEVHLFTTDGPDARAVADLARLVDAEVSAGHVVVRDTSNVDAVLDLLTRVDAVVASRLHGVILAMVAGCAPVAIAYERKVDRVMQDFGLERFSLPIATFAPDAAALAVERALQERDRIEDSVSRRVGDYRVRIREEYARVFRLVRVTQDAPASKLQLAIPHARLKSTPVRTPLVSVVTPFHNTVEYLGECIESVLAQTLPDFEYLLVNNCSTDGSAELARSWAERDARIRVIDQPTFLGQVENYNSSLTYINPETRYVKIVQADDMIVPECLARMVAVGELDPAVTIVGSQHVYGEWVLFRNIPAETPVLEGRNVCRRQLLSPHYFMGNPTTLLYRASVVRARHPFFALGRYHEDTELCFDLLRTSRFGFVPDVLSVVRVDNYDRSVTGAWRDYDWFLALRYTMLRRFGPAFLTRTELWPVEAVVTLRYAWHLLRSFLFFRGTRYFAFHKARLAEVGEALSPLTLVVWPLRVAAGFFSYMAGLLKGRSA